LKIPPIVPTQEKTKTENLYESIIGERNRVYYLTKFEQFDQQGPGGLRAGWNWSAFLCTGGWALYRKMYIWFFAFLGIAFLSSMFGKEGFIGWGALVFFLPQAAFAIFSNSLYYTSIKNKIVVAQLTIDDESKLLEHLRSIGGVHGWVFWTPVILPVTCIISILAAITMMLILTPDNNKENAPYLQNNVSKKEPVPAPSTPSAPASATKYSPRPASELAVELFKKAVAHYKIGSGTDPQKTIGYLNEAIRLKPDFADAYIQRGFVYADMKKYQMAIKDYDKAIILQLRDRLSTGNRATAYSNRGAAYGNLGEYEKAIRDYNTAIRLNPDEAVYFNNRGTAYGNLGEYERAIQDYDAAIRLNPDEAVFFNNRENSYITCGGQEEG